MPDPLVSPAAGADIDKAFWDSQVYGQLADILGAWVNYTPTLTATGGTPNFGNGSLSGRYKVLGKSVFFRVVLVWGSTGTTVAGTAWTISLPPGLPPIAATVGSARISNVGYTAGVSSSGLVFYSPSSGLYAGTASPGPAMASGQQIHANGVYDIA